MREAKKTVAAFFDTIGYDTYDAGALAEGRRFQRDLPAYVQPAWTVTAEPLRERRGAATRYRAQ